MFKEISEILKLTSYSLVLETVLWFRSVIAESRIRFQASPYLNCGGGQSDAGRGFSHIISFFSYIILPVLYNHRICIIVARYSVINPSVPVSVHHTDI